MNTLQIRHRAYFKDCYPLSENQLKVSITTGKDIDEVIMYAGDPFAAGISENEHKWTGEPVKLVKEKELENEYVWSCIVEPPFKRLKYHFEIISGDEHIYLLEDGFYKDLSSLNDKSMIQRYIFPWMNPADVMVTPKWAKDIVWYQIFPDRFNNAGDHERRNKPNKWETRDDVAYNEFFGGTIKGITDKLEYISGMGFNGIYLNPVMLSNTNHKYDTIDYTLIDPDFGTSEDMRELVDKAHELGIRVMVDGVFNHCGRTCELWKDVVEKGPQSRYYSWFFVNNWPSKNQEHVTRKGDYYAFAFVDGMPKLNTNNPEVMKYLTDIMLDWIKNWNIDGIRFDVGNEISHAFIKYIRLNIHQYDPEIFLLGEIWHDSFPWLLGDEYDSVMNYPLLQGISNFWMHKERDSRQFMYMVNSCYDMYYDQANQVMFNLLDSHDTQRLMDRCDNNRDIYWCQLGILLTLQGCPSIYYGTEIEMSGGGSNRGNRRCMPWSEIDEGRYDEAISNMTALVNIRNTYPQTKEPVSSWEINDNSRLIAYTKGDNFHVYVNADETSHEVKAGKVLFARNYNNGVLGSNGVLIALD